MKKIILIIAAAVVIGLIAWGIWFFAFSKGLESSTPSNQGASLPSVQSQTQSGTSVRVQNISSPQNPEVSKDFLGEIQNADKIALGGTVVVSPYALQIWGDVNKSGEALLKYEPSTGWILISLGGGQWNVLGLIQEGVPVSIAKQLVAGLTNGTLSPTTPPITIPAGDTIAIGTSVGNVIMNNFYKSADYIDQEQKAVVIQQASTYNIIYNISDSSFAIAITGTPFDTVREQAESAFLQKLGISQQDACKLQVWVFKPGQTGTRLSFCTNKVK